MAELLRWHDASTNAHAQWATAHGFRFEIHNLGTTWEHRVTEGGGAQTATLLNGATCHASALAAKAACAAWLGAYLLGRERATTEAADRLAAIRELLEQQDHQDNRRYAEGWSPAAPHGGEAVGRH